MHVCELLVESVYGWITCDIVTQVFFFLFSFALLLPFLLFFLSSLRPPPLSFSLLSPSRSFIVAVEEENELDISLPTRNNFDKLSELEAHIIRHRELFLSRQIETYKIDMVR